MFGKIKAALAVFRAGETVGNPAAWKAGQMTGGIVAAFLGALIAGAKAFGYDIPISDSDLASIGAGVVAVYGVYNTATTAASSKTVGLLPAKQDLQITDSPAETGLRMVGETDTKGAPEILGDQSGAN